VSFFSLRLVDDDPILSWELPAEWFGCAAMNNVPTYPAYFYDPSPMSKPLGAGRLVAFSGTDGSGKSTQADLLCCRLLDEGISARIDRYKVTEDARHVRAMSRLYHEFERHAKPVPQRLIGVILAMDLYSHIVNDIERDLSRGQWVICDRYTYDLYVSQIYLFGADFHDGWELLSMGMVPDHSFLLDVPAEQVSQRIEQRGNGRRPHEIVSALAAKREGYLEEAQRFGYFILDGRQPAQDLHQRVWRMIFPATARDGER
jgi:dTMP kinase